MKKEKKSDLAILLDYAGSHKGLTFLGLALSAVSMLLNMAPYICIWLAARDLIAAAPKWTQAQNVTRYGWLAFAFAVGGIVLYFAGLMCTHLAAFRTASNIRKQGVAHVMKAPLGFFDSNASGLIRGRLDAAAADTETLLAHNLADIVGTIVLFVAMAVLHVRLRLADGSRLPAGGGHISHLNVFDDGRQKRQADGGIPSGPGPHDQGGHRVCQRDPRSQNFPADGLFLQGLSSRPSRTTARRPSTTSRTCAGCPSPST